MHLCIFFLFLFLFFFNGVTSSLSPLCDWNPVTLHLHVFIISRRFYPERWGEIMLCHRPNYVEALPLFQGFCWASTAEGYIFFSLQIQIEMWPSISPFLYSWSTLICIDAESFKERIEMYLRTDRSLTPELHPEWGSAIKALGYWLEDHKFKP